MLLELEKTGRVPRGRSFAGWTPEMGLLADIFDRVSGLIAVMSGDKSVLKPYPRPKSVLERLEAESVAERHRDRVKLLIPHSS